RRRHTRFSRDWSSDVCSSDLYVKEYKLPEYDALVLTSEKETSDYFEEVVKTISHYKTTANWIMGPVQSYLNENGKSIADFPIPSSKLAGLIDLVEQGLINHTAAAQQVFPALTANPKADVKQLVQEMNLLIDTSQDVLGGYIDQALARFPDKVSEYHTAKKGVLGLFMDEIMKLSKGKIDPKTANKLVVEKLESLK